MSVKSNTVSFCCGCLNTEANLRNVDKKTANILSGILGLQIINNYTIKHICITCYKLLLKSVRFKEQCLEARELYLSMVHVTEGSLNTLYKLNFKPNLTQTEVTILSIDGSPPFLKTDDNTAIPEVKQIKVELKEEIVENESVLEEEFNLMQGNGFDLENYVVGDPNVAENAKVIIEVDASENVSFPTYMKLHEDVDIKEDSPQEDSLDIGDVESGTHSDDDTSLNKILKREVQNVSEEADIGTIAMHNTLGVVPQNAKRIKVEETAMDINCTVNADLKSLLKTNYKVSNRNFPKNVSADTNVDISKSKQIIQSTENCYEVNIMSPRVNIKTEKVQDKDVIVQNCKTLNSNVCYGNAENETLKPCFKSVDTVAQNALLNHEGNQTKMSNKQASENEFTCNTYENKFVIENVLNIHNRKQSKKKGSESTKAPTEVQTTTSRKKTNAQKCKEYRERKKLQNTMVQYITPERSDECSGTDQLQAKKPKTNAERRKKHYEAQKLKKQGIKKIPKTVKQKNKEYYERKKKIRIQALNTLNRHSDASRDNCSAKIYKHPE